MAASQAPARSGGNTKLVLIVAAGLVGFCLLSAIALAVAATLFA